MHCVAIRVPLRRVIGMAMKLSRGELRRVGISWPIFEVVEQRRMVHASARGFIGDHCVGIVDW